MILLNSIAEPESRASGHAVLTVASETRLDAINGIRKSPLLRACCVAADSFCRFRFSVEAGVIRSAIALPPFGLYCPLFLCKFETYQLNRLSEVDYRWLQGILRGKMSLCKFNDSQDARWGASRSHNLTFVATSGLP